MKTEILSEDPCGCRIVEVTDDLDHWQYAIAWCPVHAAAPALLEALVSLDQADRLDDHHQSHEEQSAMWEQLWQIARAAIRAARGETT